MGLMNDMYDAADQALSAHEERKRKEESRTKAILKEKAKQAAQKK